MSAFNVYTEPYILLYIPTLFSAVRGILKLALAISPANNVYTQIMVLDVLTILIIYHFLYSCVFDKSRAMTRVTSASYLKPYINTPCSNNNQSAAVAHMPSTTHPFS